MTKQARRTTSALNSRPRVRNYERNKTESFAAEPLIIIYLELLLFSTFDMGY